MPEPFPIATMDAFAPEFLAALPRRSTSPGRGGRSGERAVPLIAGAAMRGMCLRGCTGSSRSGVRSHAKAPNTAGTLGAVCTLRLPKPKRPLWKWRFLFTYRRRASVYRISPPSGAHAVLKVNRRVSPSTRYVYVYELSDMEFGRLATRGRTVSVVPDTS